MTRQWRELSTGGWISGWNSPSVRLNRSPSTRPEPAVKNKYRKVFVLLLEVLHRVEIQYVLIQGLLRECFAGIQPYLFERYCSDIAQTLALGTSLPVGRVARECRACAVAHGDEHHYDYRTCGADCQRESIANPHAGDGESDCGGNGCAIGGGGGFQRQWRSQSALLVSATRVINVLTAVITAPGD